MALAGRSLSKDRCGERLPKLIEILKSLSYDRIFPKLGSVHTANLASRSRCFKRMLPVLDIYKWRVGNVTGPVLPVTGTAAVRPTAVHVTRDRTELRVTGKRKRYYIYTYV